MSRWPGYGQRYPVPVHGFVEVIEAGAFGPKVTEKEVRETLFTGHGGMVVEEERWEAEEGQDVRTIVRARLLRRRGDLDRLKAIGRQD